MFSIMVIAFLKAKLFKAKQCYYLQGNNNTNDIKKKGDFKKKL